MTDPNQPDPAPATETPRTDAAIECFHHVWAIPVDFARQLERELAEAKAEAATYAERMSRAEDRLAGQERAHEHEAQHLANCIVLEQHRAEKAEAERDTLKQTMARIYLSLGTNETDSTKWPEQIDALRKELDDLRKDIRNLDERHPL